MDRRSLTAFVLLLALLAPSRLQAQDVGAAEGGCPPPPPPEPGENHHPWGILYSLAFAPAALAYIIPQCAMEAHADHDFSRDGFLVTAGAGGYTNEVIEGETLYGEASLLLGGLYLEAHWARYYRGISATMFTPRIGFVVRPKTGLAGGIVVGYRMTDGIPDAWRVTGFEIDVPLYASFGKDGSPWVRFGPTYRWSPEGWNFGYAGEMWFNLPRTPFMIAPFFGGQGFRGNDVVVMGVTIGRFLRWGKPSP